MTDKLYYNDSAMLDFSAELVAQKATQRGSTVCLNRSAFYPTSGGQPYDTGTLNDIPVIDVWEDDQGEVWHLLKHPLEQDTVIGHVNKTRRFNHMQQHTGQHLLSASLYNLHRANTIGFHLGSEISTIDLDIPELSWETAFNLEHQVNSVIWDNIPVTVSYVTEDEIHKIPLRKPPKVAGTIRVIWVKDYDASACGGTHVKNTGEVGLIKITGIERYKGGMRISFLCGNRALLDYQNTLRSLQIAGETLSVARAEVPEAIQRIQKELTATRRANIKAQSALLDIEAERLWLETPEVDGVRCLVQHWTDRTVSDVRRIANQLRDRHRTLLLFAVTEEKGVRLVCARSDDLSSINARHMLNDALDQLGGRGGGSPYLAQGGSQIATHEEILKVLNDVRPAVVDTITDNSEG